MTDNNALLAHIFIAAFLIAITISVIIFIFRAQKKMLKKELQRKKMEILLKEKQFEFEKSQIEEKAKSLIAEQELLTAKQKLDKVYKEIIDKNSLINQLKAAGNAHDNRIIIDQLRRSIIITDDDWYDFRLNFEKIHPFYISALQEDVPGITFAELRMICLAKLKLSHTEIAGVLGISPQSSRVTWHRFKKKHGLLEDVSLDDYANSVQKNRKAFNVELLNRFYEYSEQS